MDLQTPLLAIPANFTVQEGLSQLRISYRWMKPMYYFTLVFSIAWWTFLIFWYQNALSGFGSDGKIDWLPIIFPIAHIAAGIYIVYLTVSGFLNQTIIEATHTTLMVQHTPISLKAALKIARPQIKQLYVIQYEQNSKGGKTITYQVHAMTAAHKSVKLVSNLETAHEAKYIERKIENFLGIETQKVEGEYLGF